MGFRDLFRRAAPPPPPAPAERRFHSDRGRMFDLARAGELAALFAQSERGIAWQERFFDLAWTASVELPAEPVFVGPDGFPYLRLDIPRPGRFDSQCLANLAPDCLRQGLGAAFFASPDAPAEGAQYVLSFGLIDSLVRYDSPWGDPIDVAEAAEPESSNAVAEEGRGAWSRTMRVTESHQVMVGTPSAHYLAPHSARALARHLEQAWGLSEPRVQLLVDMEMRPHRSLVIGRKRSEFPPGAPIDDMARALLWYQTPLRQVILMPEEWSLGDMTPLSQLAADR